MPTRCTQSVQRLLTAAFATCLVTCAVAVGPAFAGTGGLAAPPIPGEQPAPAAGSFPNSGIAGQATISKDRRTALPPPDAPPAVQQAIAAANRITTRPYRYGGGHKSFRDSAYDCSGTVSYALRGIRLDDKQRIIDRPLDSRSFARWGDAGPGSWITVYTNPGHAYVIIAGLRFDTSGAGEEGPRWRREKRSNRGFRARHWEGL